MQPGDGPVYCARRVRFCDEPVVLICVSGLWRDAFAFAAVADTGDEVNDRYGAGLADTRSLRGCSGARADYAGSALCGRQLQEARNTLAAGTVSFELAQKLLASEQRKFELGAETNYFVSDTQTKLAQAELILLQTEVNDRIALAAVGHSTGDLLTPYSLQIAELSN